MPSLPTVRIVDPKDPEHYLSINEADFDPKIHKAWKEPKVDRKTGGK